MIAQPSDSSPHSTSDLTAPDSTPEPSEPTLADLIMSKVQALPPDRQQQVLDFADFLIQKNQPPQTTIWQTIDEIMAEVPDEEWEKVPTDGSYQHDHYLYGTPKREL